MRKVTGICAFVMATSLLSYGQDGHKSAPKSPRVTESNAFAEVSYGQPSKNGREIFGALVPYGQVWRTGANMSTDLTLKSDATFGGIAVEKGTYAVFTIPGEKEWTIILNSKPAQKGAGEYQENKAHNVAEIKAVVHHTGEVQEKLFIGFQKEDFVIHWDRTEVKVPLKKK